MKKKPRIQRYRLTPATEESNLTADKKDGFVLHTYLDFLTTPESKKRGEKLIDFLRPTFNLLWRLDDDGLLEIRESQDDNFENTNTSILDLMKFICEENVPRPLNLRVFLKLIGKASPSIFSETAKKVNLYFA